MVSPDGAKTDSVPTIGSTPWMTLSQWLDDVRSALAGTKWTIRDGSLTPHNGTATVSVTHPAFTDVFTIKLPVATFAVSAARRAEIRRQLGLPS